MSDTGIDQPILARCALLCNDAHLHRTDTGDWALSGDPTEGALLTLALKAGLAVREETAAATRWFGWIERVQLPAGLLLLLAC